MTHAITKEYKKKMEQILEGELEALSVDYMEKTTKEMLPSQTITMGTSKLGKMEKPPKD
jgi:hypothetical protein